MFQKGDIVICRRIGKIFNYYDDIKHKIFIGVDDEYDKLILNENYTILENIIVDGINFNIIVGKRNLLYNYYPDMIRLVELPEIIFMTYRFELNIIETRKKKIKSLD